MMSFLHRKFRINIGVFGDGADVRLKATPTVQPNPLFTADKI